MNTADFLVDTSAYIRLMKSDPVPHEWAEVLDHGLAGVCPITELEIFYSARSPEHREALADVLRQYYKWVDMPDLVYERALEVQLILDERGKRRSAGPVDLLVAATAEWHGMTVLHYDRDFATVAQVTGQPVRWLAKPGSID